MRIQRRRRIPGTQCNVGVTSHITVDEYASLSELARERHQGKISMVIRDAIKHEIKAWKIKVAEKEERKADNENDAI